jgi:hypothetical protein
MRRDYEDVNRESLTELSEILWREVFTRFPEWQEYAEIVESEASKDLKSLYVRVQSPADEQSYLSILERDDCIEVSFSDGDPPGGAESQMVCEEGSESLCVEAVLEFIQEIIDEKVVIGRGRSVWLTGHKPLPPQFIASTEIEAKRRRLVSVRSWKGRYNWEQAQHNGVIPNGLPGCGVRCTLRR